MLPADAAVAAQALVACGGELVDELLERSGPFLQAAFGPGGNIMGDFKFQQQRVCELLPTAACSRPSPSRVVSWTRRRILEWAAGGPDRPADTTAWLAAGPCLPMDAPTAAVWEICQLFGQLVVASGLNSRSDAGREVAHGIADDLEVAAKSFQNVEWQACRQDWKLLMQESLDAGGGLIHQLTKKVHACHSTF